MTKKTMKTKFILMFLAVGLVLANTAVAINVPDGDFDTPVLADNTWSYVNDMGGAWAHTYYSGSPWAGNNYSPVGMGHTGAQWLDLNAGYIHQTLTGETYEEDAIYELSIWATTTSGGQGLYLYFMDATASADGWGDAIGLSTGYHDVAVEPDLSTWSRYTHKYTATADDAGKTIGIAFYGRSVTYGDTVGLICYGVLEPVKPLIDAASVGVDETLEWTSPVAFEAEGYDVYLGTEPNKLDNPLVVDNQPTNTFDPAGDLAYETTYYWWVDAYEPNDTAPFISVAREGKRWNFTTEPEAPTILAHPKGVRVGAGQTVVFTVEQKNGTSYEWYKVGVGEAIASGTADPEGSTITLSISDVDDTDAGEYYCEVIGMGSTPSEIAELSVGTLISHWQFEENLDDSVNGNHGYSAGPGGEVTYAAGKVGDFAISLSGAEPNEVVLVDHDVDLNDDAFTVALWAKVAGGSGTWRSPLTSRSEPPLAGYNLYASTSDTWQFWTADPIGWLSIGSTAVVEGEWVFLVATYDARTLEKILYVNGVAAAQTTLSEALNLNPASNLLKIGGGGGGDASLCCIFNGLIDDVKIWNYAINPYGVAKLYTDVEGGTICAEPGSLLYDFDDNCMIGIGDIAEFALQWLACNFAPDCLDEHTYELD